MKVFSFYFFLVKKSFITLITALLLLYSTAIMKLTMNYKVHNIIISLLMFTCTWEKKSIMAALLTFLSTFKLFKSSSVSLELEPLHQHFSQQIVGNQHFSQEMVGNQHFSQEIVGNQHFSQEIVENHHFSQQIVADQHFSQLLFNKSKFNLYEA